jgi:catechol 2,3-dioxygenase-like lactoylglutathione lyase family enzyme
MGLSEHNDSSHERLQAIAGRWATSGHVIAEPPVPVVGTDIYEVLEGGRYLVHHVDVTVGEQAVRAIEVIGEPDPDTDGYLARAFDNDGKAEVMRLTIDDDGVFHFAGGSEIARSAQPGDVSTARVRSTLTVAPDRSSMKALWERSEDGETWQPWMDMTFTRMTTDTGLGNGRVATRLPAQDLERARAFYSEKLGLEPAEEREGGLRYVFAYGEFALFQSTGSAAGDHTQMGWEVDDIEATVRELRDRGVVFEEYDLPGLKTVDGIAEIEGQYPSKGSGERGAWFRDSEGNMLAIGQLVG